ncbi:MAG TPA: hypothetical protein VH592_14125 [Gemmataceae bacterium]|jgi:hypothetical protein
MHIVDDSPSVRQSRRSPTSEALVRLSVETASGRHRRVSVAVQRSPGDDDRALMQKASTKYRHLHGFADRVVAIYTS